MTNGCCRGDEAETLIFTCAGAAYSGQVSNRAGVNLMQNGAGNLFCIAAVSAGIPDKLERARKAGVRVAIDGCEEHCTRKILQAAALSVEVHVDVSLLGVEKKPDRPEMVLDARRVTDHVMASL